MKKIELSQEEVEMMNYNDIAYLILEKKGKKMKIIDLFNEVGKLLNMDSDEFQAHITDFFELLSTDKRFIMLDKGYWDLSIKHNKGMLLEEDDEEDEEELIIEEDDVQEDYDDEDTSDDDVEEDDLSDLVIIDDTDDESNM